MVNGSIAFVALKPVAGVLTSQFDHQPVTGDLGDNRGGSYRQHAADTFGQRVLGR